MQRGKILIGILVVFGLISIGFGFDQTGNECICYNATDCNNAIASSSCSLIKLGKDIDGQIVFNNVSNKVLDGQNHKIIKDYGGSIRFIKTNSNITIRNVYIVSGNNFVDVGVEFDKNSTNSNIIILNSFIRAYSVGIDFDRYSNNINVLIENSSISGGHSSGIHIWNSNNINITIKNCNISGYYVIYWSIHSFIKNFKLYHCYIDSNNGINGNYIGKRKIYHLVLNFSYTSPTKNKNVENKTDKKPAAIENDKKNKENISEKNNFTKLKKEKNNISKNYTNFKNKILKHEENNNLKNISLMQNKNDNRNDIDTLIFVIGLIFMSFLIILYLVILYFTIKEKY